MNKAILSEIYKSYNKEVRKVLFPLGADEIGLIASKLSQLLDIEVLDNDLVRIKEVINIYVDIFILKSAFKDDQEIIEQIKKNHPLLTDDNKAMLAVSYTILHNEKDEVTDEDINELLEEFISAKEFINANKGLENVHIKDDDYGLVKEKPIYVHGSAALEQYFGSIIRKDSQQISYEYVDSHSVENINGFVDEYVLKDQQGNIVSNMFINIYGYYSSNKAPKGFSYKKVNADKAVVNQQQMLKKDFKKSVKKELIVTIVVAIIVIIVLVLRKMK